MRASQTLESAQLPAAGAAGVGEDGLIESLLSLRRAMAAQQKRLAGAIDQVAAVHRASAINLSHYLALRQADRRRLQEQLAAMGLSSLGRAETHVMDNVERVLALLHRLAGRPWPLPEEAGSPVMANGRGRLARHAAALFGPAPAERGVRIMVTLPGEAAHDASLVDALVAAGMDIARINCAHDSADAWAAMAASVRRAAQQARRPVQVLMDLAGPKLRTGALAPGAPVIKLKPERDAYGQVLAAARLGLRAAGATSRLDGVAHTVDVDPDWLQALGLGDRIDVTDARSARRRLTVVELRDGAAVVASQRTVYLTEKTPLRLHVHGEDLRITGLAGLPRPPGRVRLQRGDRLQLVADDRDRLQPVANPGDDAPASIVCTLPEALAAVRKGERIWFDDGRIGGVVRSASRRRVLVEITEARDGGDDLAADKGINLPDTVLDLPALTAKDLQDLRAVALHADIVGLSFAQSAADVKLLRDALAAIGVPHLGVILKIETRRGFECLPELLLAAMAGPAAGVMIARGDLAVECGYERLAEVQEEILWACEAAHMPVVWATQVLETLAKTGRPSRAEVTDAAMGGRAECVMLNKGPHIVEAIRTLDDILRRMQAHQSKKRPLLRALKSWGPVAPAPG